MPGDTKHHTAEFRSCVEQVMAKGESEDSAYAICTTSLQGAGKPIFEAAEELRHLHLRGAIGKVRTEMYGGREHIVVPVVALMEGVIHAVNAETPEFVPLSTLQKAASSWNGRPVVLGHPVKHGKQCSANAPDILVSHGIGTIFNSRVEGKKLLQEAWIDREKAQQLDAAMVDRLLNEKIEEVSVGAYVVTNNEAGAHNGKRYMASWLDTTGDHLAFLPGGRGACSVAMGCGAHRAATMRVCEDSLEIDEEITAAAGARNSATDLKRIQDMHDKAVELGAECSTQNVRFMETSNTMTFIRVPAAVREKIEATFVTAMKNYKDCVDCKGTGSKNGNPCETCEGNGKLKAVEETPGQKLRRAGEHLAAVKRDANPDNIDIGDTTNLSAAQIEAEVTRVTGQGANTPAPTPEELDKILTDKAAAGEAAFKAACRCEEDTSMTPEQKAEIIKTLVADKHSGFVAGDEKMLEAAPDARLESFSVAAEARAKREDELKAASERKLSTEEFMAVAPPELKSLITRQQRQETEVKAQLVATLKAAQNEYSEAELSVLSVDDLSRMARMAKVDAKIDFSGRGVPRTAAAGDEEDFTPPNPYDAQLKALKASQTAH